MLVGLLCAGTAPAWAIYKIVGPDGQVTFSDMPPPPGKGKVQTLDGTPSTPVSTMRDFPPALRDAARKYPVTLFTTRSCPACDEGRQYLRERGIPYVEKTVTTSADIEDFKKFGGQEARFPLLTLGSTKLPTGFSASAWGDALDAAGYPKANELPQSYKQPAPQPLVAPKVEKKASPAERGLPDVPVRPPENPNAPPGFQF